MNRPPDLGEITEPVSIVAPKVVATVCTHSRNRLIFDQAAVNKLSAMQDQFMNFERQMEEDARLKRSSEDARVASARYVYNTSFGS